MTQNADSGASEWWQQFAQACVEGGCTPCPTCGHQHDCWWCEFQARSECATHIDSSGSPDA